MKLRFTSVVAIAAVLLAVAGFLYYAPSCSSCDDGNPCTEDYCSKETEYSCVHRTLSGPQQGCSGVGEGCGGFYCRNASCTSNIMSNCCGNGYCEVGESEADCLKDCGGGCPASCDDKNPCTRDFCGITTNYSCIHEGVISNECKTACPVTCDDGNPCTEDFCSQATGFQCFHTPMLPCCGDHICSTGEELACFGDCPMRDEPLTALPPFKAIEGANWVYPYSMDVTFLTDSEDITYRVRCGMVYVNGSTGFFLPYITESRRMGRFDEQETEGGFNGFLECVEGACVVDPAYSKELRRGTRIRNASRGAKARAYFYVVLKDRFFYDETVDGRVPKEEIASVVCNFTLSSEVPPQTINDSVSIRFKPSCSDKIRDEGEAGVDCGGPCAPCKCLTKDDCERSGPVGKPYCWTAFSVSARNYKYVECAKPLYGQPFCNVTVVPRDLGYPCLERGYY